MTTNPEAASALPAQPIQSTTQPDAIKAPGLTNTPKAGFRPFFNPATGEWITYTSIAEDNGGQLVRFTWRSVPGGVITEHIHPRQEERFTIVAGQAHFTLNGQHHVAGPGETVIVPAGVPHSEGNPGPAEIDGIVELRPALRAKELHEAFAGLVADGKTTPRGGPRNPLQLGATFWHFRHESRVTSPPIWAQNLMLPPLWALAKAFGVRPYYDRWDSRIQDAGSGHPELPATDRRQCPRRGRRHSARRPSPRHRLTCIRL
jgi:quercetin dioxygenase-like cupin family protein